MNKVFPIGKKRFLGGYSLSQENPRVPRYAIFLAGVVLTMVVPVISYCSYRGPVPPLVFAGIALAGTTVGLIRYRLLPGEVVTRLCVGTAPQTPSQEDMTLKKAA